MESAASTPGGKVGGYKIVPWSSWAQWLAVRDGLFSNSPEAVAAALRRISGWRSRRSLPTPIDVTTAFVEVLRMDPISRTEKSSSAVASVEILVMLYSMAIMRLVNCFVEPAHKQALANNNKKPTIADLAEAIGIPRVLVDIRHESSHRDLPSLPLLRSAAHKALNWLLCNYWEPQRYALPDASVEIAPRLQEVEYHLKIKSKKKNGEAKGPLERVSKVIAQMYSSDPSEAVEGLLNFFKFDTSSLNHIDIQQSGVTVEYAQSDAFSNFKKIVTKVSRKEPRLLLSLLKNVLGKIDTQRELHDDYSSKLSSQEELSHLKTLFALAFWIVTALKELQESGKIAVLGCGTFHSEANAKQAFRISKLLNKCITLLSVINESQLREAVLLLTEMIGDESMKRRLKMLPLLRQDGVNEKSNVKTGLAHGSDSLQSDSLTTTGEVLNHIKAKLNNSSSLDVPAVCHAEKPSSWKVTESWIPCPIGMLPCSLSLTPILPLLDVDDGEPGNSVSFQEPVGLSGLKRSESDLYPDGESLDVEKAKAGKKLRMSASNIAEDIPERALSREPMLRIDGIWQTQSQAELLEIRSRIRILV